MAPAVGTEHRQQGHFEGAQPPSMAAASWGWPLLLIGGVLGVVLQLQQRLLWEETVYAGSAVLGALLLLGVRGRPGRAIGVWRWGVGGLALALLMWGQTGWRACQQAERAWPALWELRDVVLRGAITALPRQGPSGWQVELEAEGAWVGQRQVSGPLRVRLSWRGTPVPALAAGQRWELTARLRRPQGVFNPHGFDTELWLWEQGVQATGQVRMARGVPAPRHLEQTGRHPIERARQWAREGIQQRVSDPHQAGVLVALLAGDQASIPAADWGVFRATGIAHLISVSGTHVTLFAWLAVWAVGGLWRGLSYRWPGLLLRISLPVAAGWGGVLLATLYALFAGWGVPAQRTVLMLAALTTLRLSGRTWPWPVVWLLAMNLVLWLDPWALLQSGFWLSFVAVGVLFGSALPWQAGPVPWRQQLWAVLRTQAVVTLALAPLTLLLFGQISLVSLLANLPAIPWVTLVVTPLAMAGVVWGGFWQAGAWAVQALLYWLEWLATWPLAVLERPALPLSLALLSVLGGVIMVLRWPLVWRLWGALLFWPALAYQPPRPALGSYELLLPDIGQGTAVIVRTRHHLLVYDTGPPWGSTDDMAQRVLLPWLRALGQAPDAVAVSHADSDHAGGLPSLVQAYPNTPIWWASYDTQPVTPVPARPCLAGEHWEWDGVRFEWLHPSPADLAAARSDNALSCVLKIGEGDRVTLLTGDIGIAEETALALRHPGLRARVLVAAHHGSHTSSGPVWLNTVRPEWVLIQSGFHNRFRHPAPIVLRRYQARGIPWFNSPGCGAMRWNSRRPDQAPVCARADGNRYWNFPYQPDWRAPARVSDPAQPGVAR